ncbi:MAG: tetraacyldisaccharide 4'-kinase, partial [Bacillota bacterium]
REPMRGLRRADAFVLTRSDQVSPGQSSELEGLLRRWNPQAPTYRAMHAHTGLRGANGGESIPVEELAQRRFLAFAGIGQPGSLDRQLTRFGKNYCGHCWFEDHHDYREGDLARMRQQARDAGADVLVVTEKDWAKIQRLDGARESRIPIWRLEVQIAMDATAEAGLLALMKSRLTR